jgi:hypothetical protein
MQDMLTQLWQELAARPDGPLAIRFYLQPLMAMLLAVRDGIKDAHEGRPAYFWALFSDKPHRRELLRSGWSSVGKVFVIAVKSDPWRLPKSPNSGWPAPRVCAPAPCLQPRAWASTQGAQCAST